MLTLSTISTTVTGALSFKLLRLESKYDQILILRSVAIDRFISSSVLMSNGKQRISQTQLSGLQWINVASIWIERCLSFKAFIIVH